MLWPRADRDAWGVAWAGLDQPWTFEPLDPPLAVGEVQATDALLGPDGAAWLAVRRTNGEILAYRWTPGSPARGEQVAPYVQSRPSWPEADDLWLDVHPDGTVLLTFARRQPFAAEHAAVYVATRPPAGGWSTELVFAPDRDADPELRLGGAVRGVLLPDGRPAVGVLDGSTILWRWRAAPETWVELTSRGPGTDDLSDLRALGCAAPRCFDAVRDLDGTVWFSPSTTDPPALLPLRVDGVRLHPDHLDRLPLGVADLQPDEVIGLPLRPTPCGLTLPRDQPCAGPTAAPFTSPPTEPAQDLPAHGSLQPYALALRGDRLIGGRTVPEDPAELVPWIPPEAMPRLIDLTPPTGPVESGLTTLTLTLDHAFATAEVHCSSATPGQPAPMRIFTAAPAPWTNDCDGALLLDGERWCTRHTVTLRAPTGLPAGHRLWCHLAALASPTATANLDPLLAERPPRWTWTVSGATTASAPNATATCAADACGCLPFPVDHPTPGRIDLDLRGDPALPATLLLAGEEPVLIRADGERVEPSIAWWSPATPTGWEGVSQAADGATLTWTETLRGDSAWRVELPDAWRDAAFARPWEEAAASLSMGPGPLALVDHSPSAGATGVDLASELLLRFSLPLDADSLDDLALTNASGPIPFAAALVDPTTLRMTPLEPLEALTEHTVGVPDSLRSTADTCDRAPEAPLAWSFTTGP